MLLCVCHFVCVKPGEQNALLGVIEGYVKRVRAKASVKVLWASPLPHHVCVFSCSLGPARAPKGFHLVNICFYFSKGIYH